VAVGAAAAASSTDVNHRIFDTASDSSTSSVNSKDKTPLIILYLRDRGINASSLEDMDADILLSVVPFDNQGKLTSLGAVMHRTQQCAPCMFSIKGHCKKAWRCTYCHLPHAVKKSKRLRPSKATRTRLKMRENANLDAENHDDSSGSEQAQATLSHGGSQQVQPDNRQVATNHQPPTATNQPPPRPTRERRIVHL